MDFCHYIPNRASHIADERSELAPPSGVDGGMRARSHNTVRKLPNGSRSRDGHSRGISEDEIKDVEELATPRTPVIYEVVRRLGEEEMARPSTSLWWSGVAAGLSISFVAPDTFFTSRRVQLATLTARDRIPAFYGVREIVAVGGLMSYGANVADMFHQLGVYTGSISRGPSLASCRCYKRTNLNLSSTCRRRERSASRFHENCFLSPTR